MPVKLNAESTDKLHDLPIAYVQIENLKKNYNTNLPVLPDGNLDATSAWVSIYELNALIADNNANGIRIYYGRHGANDIYPYHHGIVMVATYDSVTPQHPTTTNSVDLLNKDPKQGPVNSVSFSGDGPYTGNGDDAIPLCPPACLTGHKNARRKKL